ncbi:MAG: hypothetical protein ACYCVL_07170 [Gemmatimonadaceae bacterium]
MPDLCWNLLRVEGSFADRREFEVWNQTIVPPASDDDQLWLALPLRALEAHLPLLFDVMVPVPDQVAILGANYARTWQLDNWGTLGNPESVVERIDDGRSLNYEFRTPGSPPRAWLFSVSRLFPDLMLSLDFAEPVSGCVGTFAVANELILQDVEAETSEDAEYIMWNWFGMGESASGAS